MPDLEELLSPFDPERQERLRQLIARRKQFTPQQLNPEAEYGVRPTDDSAFWNQVNQATLPTRQSPNIAWQTDAQPPLQKAWGWANKPVGRYEPEGQVPPLADFTRNYFAANAPDLLRNRATLRPSEEQSFITKEQEWLLKARQAYADIYGQSELTKASLRGAPKGMGELTTFGIGAGNIASKLLEPSQGAGAITPLDIAYGALDVAAVSPLIKKGVQSVGRGVEEGAKVILGEALNAGLDKWIAKMSRGVPPDKFKDVQNALYNFIAKDRVWLQEQATNNWLTRKGMTPNVSMATQQAVDDTIAAVENRFRAVIPRGTQTGAMAFGGKAVRPIPPEPIIPKPEVSIGKVPEPTSKELEALTHLSQSPTQKTSNELYLRKTFGDDVYDSLREKGLISRTPDPTPSKAISAITVKGREILGKKPLSKTSGKTPNMYGIGKAILTEDMTIGDWWKTGQTKEQLIRDFGDRPLRNSVKQALSEGKPVPAEVLKDYPELAKKAPVAVPEAKAVTPTAPAVEVPKVDIKSYENIKAPESITTEQELATWWNNAFVDATASIRTEADKIMQRTKGTYEERLAKSDAWEQKQLQPFKDFFMAKAKADAKAKGVVFTKLEAEIPAEAAKPPVAQPSAPEPPKIPPPPEVPPVQQPPPKQPDFAGNIRLSKYPEDLRQQLIDYANTHADEIVAARRGVRSDAQVLSDAKQLIEENGANFDKIQRKWKPGESWNAEEITAMRGLLRTKTEAVTQAQQLVKESNSTSNLLKLEMALQEHANAQRIVHGITAEAGRSLRSFRQEAFNAIKSNDNQKMEELLKRLGGREHIENLAEKIGQLDLDNPGQVARFLSQVSQKSKSEKFWGTLTWIFYSSILSGPKTQIINTLTNVGNAFAAPVFRAGAVPYDILLSGGGKFRPRARFLSEVPADVVGAMQGIPEGARAWLYTWKHGISWNQASKWDFRQPAVAYTPVGRVLGSPLTGLESADAFMKQVNFRSAFNATAHRMASQEKLTGQAFTERVADLLSNPPQKLITEADKIAEYQLFRQKPDSFIQGLINLREKGIGEFKPLTFVVPFLRTPSNILKYGLERSPLGLLNPKLWKNIGAKNPEAADQLARITIGSMLAAAVATYFADGRITGAAPKDRAERDTFYRQGKQPFSIRIGDTWVSFQRLEPLNQTFAQVAAVVDAVKDKATKGIDQMASQAVSTIGQNLVSQTYLSSLSDLLDALNDPERNAANWLSRFGASLAVPFSAASRTAAQMLDPTVRQPSGVVEQIQANIPGLTQRVPAKITALGEETKRLAYPWFPIAISPAQEDALTNELTRLNKDVGFVGSAIANVKLDPDKQKEYQVQAGQMTKSFLIKLISNSEYKRATDVQKGYMIDELISDARKKARNEILPTLDLPLAEKVRVKFSQFGASIAQFEKTLGYKWDDPKVEAIIRTADKYLTPYWQVESDVWNQTGAIPGTNVQYKVLSDAWEKLAKKDAKKAKELMFNSPYGPVILNARREILLKKRDMRLNTPMLESMLKLFY